MPEPTTRVYENFRDYLAARFSNTAAIRTFVCSPPISIAEADFPREGSARDAWQVILTWAQTHNKYALLVQQTILGFEPDRAVIEAYAAEWEAAAPPQPPKVNLANPYPGLKSFEEKDHDYFFGREQWVRDITAELGRHAFFCLYGGSGSGKSSLLGAGVIPRWKRETGGTVIHFTPGMDPFASLLSLGLRNDSDAEAVITDAKAGKRTDLFQELHRRLGQGSQMLVVMDQAEQLFTRTTDKEMRKRFLACLFAPLPDGVHILIGMRNDYMDVWNTVLPAHLTQHLLLRPPTESEVRDIVIEPARKHHAFFEAAMAKELLDRLRNLEGSSPLPLLQFLLKQLWAQSPPKDGILRFEAYQALGGVDGALRKHIENFIREHPGREADIQNILLALVRFEEREGKYLAFAKSAPRSGLPQDLVDALLSERWRLLTTSHEPGHIEFAHEVVMAAWPGFEAFKAQHGTILAIRSDIIEDTGEWKKAETSRAKRQALWTGIRLERGLMHAGLGPYDGQVDQFALSGSPLSTDERDFLLAGWEERKRYRKTVRQIQIALTTLGLVIVASSAFSLWQTAKLTAANKQTNAVLAESSWQVGREYRGDPYKTIESSSILATHHLLRSAISYERAGDITARNHALLAAKVASAELCFTVPIGGVLHKLATMGGREMFLCVDEAGTLSQIDLEKGTRAASFKVPTVLSWSRDGGQMLTSDGDQHLAMVSTETGLVLGNPIKLPRRTYSTAISDDSKLFVSRGEGDIAYLGGTHGNSEPVPLPNIGRVIGAIFAPGSKHVVTWGEGDWQPRLWDTKGNRLWESESKRVGMLAQTLASPLPDREQIGNVVFDSTGEQYASVDNNGHCSIFLTSDGKRLASLTLEGFLGGFMRMAFHPHGNHLLLCEENNNLWLATRTSDNSSPSSPWNLKKLPVRAVTAAAFTPKGNTIITLDTNGFITGWEGLGTWESWVRGAANTWFRADMVFQEDSSSVLISDLDNVGYHLDVQTGRPLLSTLEHSKAIKGTVFCSGGRRIATYDSGCIRVWEPKRLLREIAPNAATKPWKLPHMARYCVSKQKDGSYRLKPASQKQIGAEIVAFPSHDGQRVLSMDHIPYSGKAGLWWASTGEAIGTPMILQGASYLVGEPGKTPARPRAAYNYAIFSPDDSLVMFCSYDTVNLARVADGSLIAAFSIYPFNKAAFTEDGKSLLFSKDGKPMTDGTLETPPQEKDFATMFPEHSGPMMAIDLDFPTDVPASRYLLEFEVRSATVLGNEGVLRDLGYEEWERKRAELKTLEAKVGPASRAGK